MAGRFFTCVLALAATASCSLVIDRDANQCVADRDCMGFSGTSCDTRAHLCVMMPRNDGGVVNPGGGSDANGDGGTACGDDGGCYACTPTNDVQFGNACT